MYKSDKGKFTLREFKLYLMKVYRDRGRLVASLSGVKSAIQKVDDFLTFILWCILILGAL